jgi:hypothetical protein
VAAGRLVAAAQQQQQQQQQQQAAAAVQHVVVQTLLQQQQALAGTPSVSAFLGQPQAAPGTLQLLQAISAAGGLPAPRQPSPAGTVPAAPGLLPSLPPAVAAAAAGCPQLLQALGAATAAPQAVPLALPGFGGVAPAVAAASRLGAAGSLTAGSLVARPMTGAVGGVPHSAALMGAVPASGLAATSAQLQALFGQLPAVLHNPLHAAAAAPVAPGWNGLGHVSAMLGLAGMQPPQMHASRIAV